jgi:cell division protein FtsQ
MKLSWKIRREVKVTVILLLAVISIALVEKRQSETICTSVHINIINPEQSNFVDENEIRRLVTADKSVPLVGSAYPRIYLKEIESRTESNLYIQEAQVYKDHRGDVFVDVYIARPIARILRPGARDTYISDKGNLIETSTKYTSRVLLISGSYVKNLNKNLRKDQAQRDLFDFLRFIYKDKFWKAQISQIDINTDGELIIYPQITKQYIQFGTIEDWQKKMYKLKIFYSKILPFRGWNNYSRVNLEYENQIICE